MLGKTLVHRCYQHVGRKTMSVRSQNQLYQSAITILCCVTKPIKPWGTQQTFIFAHGSRVCLEGSTDQGQPWLVGVLHQLAGQLALDGQGGPELPGLCFALLVFCPPAA